MKLNSTCNKGIVHRMNIIQVISCRFSFFLNKIQNYPMTMFIHNDRNMVCIYYGNIIFQNVLHLR